MQRKTNFPIEKVRRFLEPGPVVLVSSQFRGERDIMTLGWHMMMEYTLLGCFIWDQNHSHDLIKRSRECVINVPTFDMIDVIHRHRQYALRRGNKCGAEAAPSIPPDHTPLEV